MRLLKTTTLLFTFLFALQSGTAALNTPDRFQALDLFKQYVNNMVQRVEKAKDPVQKRKIMNNSFDKMVTAFNKALAIGVVTPKDQKAVNKLKTNILEKKNELNGKKGYRRVADNRLNNFANYVQQDLEQADTVTISISVTLLVLILVLLLLL